jgi:hypothetical protein
MKFYPRAWAKYAEAVSGTIRLIPSEFRLAALSCDYADMSEMLFGEYPTFKELMAAIRNLEDEINDAVCRESAAPLLQRDPAEIRCCGGGVGGISGAKQPL